MKSRKSAKANQKSLRADRSRKALRNTVRAFETLEDRKLMTVTPWSDGYFYPPLLVHTGTPVGRTAAEVRAISAIQFAPAGSNSGGLNGEGLQPFINVGEIEPNNNASQAQFINLGTGAAQSSGAAIVGRLATPVLPGQSIDEDYFAFDLKAGDIFDARVNGPIGIVFDLSIQNSNRVEVFGTRASNSAIGVYPLSSPINVTATVPNADLAFVVPATGRYYARVSDGDAAYTLTLNARRPTIEAEPVGTKQKIFLDFDGALIRREIFGAGIPGTARLSALSTFLPGWGLTAADENRVIDRIVDIFKSHFNGSSNLATSGGNGHYGTTGIPGQFDIEILNSRDHADPFGQPNVSRIILGGTIAEFLIPTIGLAQSIDVGNFNRQETAVVLLDNIVSNFVQPIPRAANKSAEDVIVTAVANVAVHEAGHYTGAWHTDPTNANRIQMMDAGGTIAANAGLIGAGADGIFGNVDDVKPIFGTDTFDPVTGPNGFGFQATGVLMAFGLATGTTGGATITGNVFRDVNFNRTRDSSDIPMGGVSIYVDSNNNGSLDATEVRVMSNSDGDYRLTVLPGTYTVREVPPSGPSYKVVAPANNAHVVTVTAGQTVTGRNFANELINESITGIKWNDFNGNGLRDAGEPGIGGVFIYIDLDRDGRIDIGEPAAQTGADGSYRLTFPGAGTFAIREVLDPGFTQSFPGSTANNEHVIVLTGNPTIDSPRSSGLNFGNLITIDYGDAPSSYGIASAGRSPGLTLGSLWDAEQASQFSVDALGDDNNGIDDEDAINLAATRPLIRSSNNNPIQVATTNTTGQTAYLQAWIDFNGDGDFLDSGEKVVSNLAVTGTALPTLNVAVPATARIGNTFARLRLSTTRDVGPTGQTIDGEVEDYRLEIVGELILAVPDSATVRRNSVLNPIDVLANDFKLAGETLEVINVSQPGSGGLVTFTASGVLYTPPSGFIGRDTFTYTVRNSNGEIATATVTVDVNLFFDNPLAIDDSFEVPTNAVDFPLNVLANDIEGQNGALSIVSVTQPDKGGSLIIATGNKSLRYTPSRDFGGTEFFTYVVADAAGNRSTAQGTIHTLPGDRANDRLQIRLVATDLAGVPISAIQQGQQFRIDLLVDDLRFDSATPSPDLAAGVFAAYTDLLYNLQLVGTVAPTTTTPSGFNFAVNFFNNYENGRTGDATIPGIINELGAFFDGSNMNRVNEVRLASVIFEAKTPGIATFLADPADVKPGSDSLLFDTSATAVPIDQIRYLGTSIEVVGNGVVFPTAVDDSLVTPIPTNSIQFPINVLANDLPGSSGPITLQSVSAPMNGSTRINAGRVEYTPSTNFTGSDQFTYTIVDSRGTQSVGRVTLKVGNTADADDIVDLQLRITDLSGASIEQITVGQKFQLRGFVKDLRTSGSRLGVFAAYQDVIYPAGLVAPVSSTTNDPNLGFEVSFGPNYQRVREGDVRTRGLINEIGAVSTGDSPLGTAEQLLFVVTLTASSVGTASFVGDPADISPFHDTLTYEPVTAVGFSNIRYGSDSVVIVNGTGSGNAGGEFTNAANPLDVNNDGFVSPIDALVIINALNSGGSRALTGGSGEGESGGRMYIDTNADGFLSAIDVLGVVNFLNRQAAFGSGEGEGNSHDAAFAGDDLLGDDVDDLINQLAPSIEETWKKKG